jgi:amino acid adenylation domain-containing protein
LLVDLLLRRAAQASPDAEALVSGGRRLTYAQLDSATDTVAAGFQSLGVVRGDRVAVHLENGVEAVLSIMGALRAGAAFVPINPTTKGAKLGYLLRDSGASLLVSDRRAAHSVAEARGDLEGPLAIVMAGVAREGTDDRPTFPYVRFEDLESGHMSGLPWNDPRIDLDLAALIYTSGSTGRPKGVMMTHGNILAATTSINGYLQNRRDDTILDVLPLSFDYGLYQLFLAMQAGARVLLERSFAFPTVMLELMARERVSALPIVPMLAALLLKHDLASYDLGALRYITNTGAVLPPAHIAALRTALPQARIFSMYGLTDCKRVSFLAPEDLDARPTSVGKPMSNVEVYLLDEEGRRVDCGIGELVVRGSNVMQGYWRAEAATEKVLRPGLLPGEKVLHTGDLFRIDEDGYMYFQSRTDDVIKSRGQKVSPREIENVLHAAPGVSEAVVVGVPDALLGQALHAYVTLRPGASVTARDILLYCSKHLEDFMVPGIVEVVSTLPHTSSGKLARRGVLSSATE